MRHLTRKHTFGRPTGHRVAMLRNMITSLLEYERIVTTLAKAKEARRFADRMITLGKKGTLAQRRRALSFIRSKGVTHKLFTTLAARYKERNGGYTRIFKLGSRMGDAAPMAVLELVDRDPAAAPKKRKKRVPAAEQQPAQQAAAGQ